MKLILHVGVKHEVRFNSDITVMEKQIPKVRVKVKVEVVSMVSSKIWAADKKTFTQIGNIKILRPASCI